MQAIRPYWHVLLQVKPPEEVRVQNLTGCLRTITPAMLVVLSWAYVVLANINLEFFNCAKRGGQWFLAAEPSVQCYDFESWDNQHAQLLPLCCAAVAVYVIGVPALFATLLFRRRKVGGLGPVLASCRSLSLGCRCRPYTPNVAGAAGPQSQAGPSRHDPSAADALQGAECQQQFEKQIPHNGDGEPIGRGRCLGEA